jgi:hypothetical protein
MIRKIDYPLPPQDWVRLRCVTSDLEIVAAHKKGFVQSSDAIADLWAGLNPADLERIGALESSSERLLLDKYFALLLIRLYEVWFLTAKPKKALEYLVLDFRESLLIGIFDKKLPAFVAGISEIDELGSSSQELIRIHKWLGDYAAALLAHEILSWTVM